MDRPIDRQAQVDTVTLSGRTDRQSGTGRHGDTEWTDRQTGPRERKWVEEHTLTSSL